MALHGLWNIADEQFYGAIQIIGLLLSNAAHKFVVHPDDSVTRPEIRGI
ncbi:hypothetical protein BMS3Abin07_02590 [bacterium BMS3Abin07]|nr:hypothetical protein BMS3Abin07_02590 [bacterium BMS3Abin07]GBE32347.1 hypothetical protein BMS3Bbin05_01260 [bacterium BMS3Bbin05]